LGATIVSEPHIKDIVIEFNGDDLAKYRLFLSKKLSIFGAIVDFDDKGNPVYMRVSFLKNITNVPLI